jgi:hypothetical protein
VRELPQSPLGSRPNERGERLIWLDHATVSRLRAMRGRGESYSDAILRLVEQEGSHARRSLAG